MSTARLFSVTTALTVGAVVVWGVKALVIGLAGGLDQSPLEGPLFLLGFVLFTLGVIAVGLAVTAGRPVLWRVGGAIAAVVLTAVLFLAIDTVVAAMAPERDAHWVWAEVQLWTSSVLVAAAWLVLRRRAAPVALAS